MLLVGVESHPHVPFCRRQCVIYDSDRADARLIGIEYVVSEDVRILGLAASRLELAQNANVAGELKLTGKPWLLQVFLGLPEEEKKYWHSRECRNATYACSSNHCLRSTRLKRRFALTDKYEVESGQLTLKSKNFVPVAAEDMAERSVMKELQTTYGKVSCGIEGLGSLAPVSGGANR